MIFTPLDYAIALVSFLIFGAGLKREYRTLAVLFQSSLLFLRLVRVYVKNIPKSSNVSLRELLLYSTHHYFTTHHHGKLIAERTNIHDTIHNLLAKVELRHDHQIGGVG